MTRDAVRAYYDSFGEREWARLARPEDGAVEFAVTRQAIAAHLPPGARVLDLGGGPGRYALWLAERGHRVTLADLSPALLALARAKVAAAVAGGLVEEIVEADARDRSRWADGAFDAALALGPFYHLPDPADRERAAAELARVLRPGGLAFVALMPRYALLRRALEDGVFVSELPGRFTGGYGARPEEVAPFFARHGFATLALLACEGIVPDLQAELAELAAAESAAYQAMLDVIIRTAGDPSILGLSNHLLYIGRKAA